MTPLDPASLEIKPFNPRVASSNRERNPIAQWPPGRGSREYSAAGTGGGTGGTDFGQGGHTGWKHNVV